MFAGVGQGFTRLAIVVDEENNLSPDQSQSGPPKETVSPLKGVVELGTHSRIGED